MSRFLTALFPPANPPRFVFTVRHPGAVVKSALAWVYEPYRDVDRVGPCGAGWVLLHLVNYLAVYRRAE